MSLPVVVDQLRMIDGGQIRLLVEVVDRITALSMTRLSSPSACARDCSGASTNPD